MTPTSAFILAFPGLWEAVKNETLPGDFFFVLIITFHRLYSTVVTLIVFFYMGWSQILLVLVGEEVKFYFSC